MTENERIPELVRLKLLLAELFGKEIPYGLHTPLWELMRALERHGY